jgi:Cu(I)/Ag(I) efflux system membrane fusion protein
VKTPSATWVIAFAAALAVLAVVARGSYWLGTRSRAPAAAALGAAAAAPASAPQARKLLYYRNPMGLADTSPTPKKDAMGMDYVAVYEESDVPAAGEPAAAHQVRISSDKVQKLGVRAEPATLRALGRTLRAPARVEVDERRIVVVTAKFEGYVDRLLVNATGQAVAKGQLLFDAYSSDLVAVQREYLVAVQGQLAMKDATADAQGGLQRLADSALARLRNWDWSPEQVAGLVRSGQAQRTVAFVSPVSGVVTDKKVQQGMRFMPGEMLYQVTDLSALWVIADLSEQDMRGVKPGARARVTVTAYPGETFEGRVTQVYPTLKAETRSVPVRVELANPGLRLKPAMFAQVELAVGERTPVLTVPDSAVIDTGTRRLVLVQLQEGRFEPREVRTGGRSDAFIEVTHGLREGEQVVVAANFLIDAESNLKAVVRNLGTPASPPAAASAAVSHRAEGRIDSIDPATTSLVLEHGPVATLKWPSMTMEFKLADKGLLKGLKAGQRVRFEFAEGQPGEFVINAIQHAH